MIFFCKGSDLVVKHEPGFEHIAGLDDFQSPISGRTVENGQTRGLAWRISFRVALLTSVAFVGILDTNFVAWDDTDNFLGNAAYQGLGFKQVY